MEATPVRRNPPRRARPPPTPLAGAKSKPSSFSRLLEDEAASAAAPRPPTPPQEESLKVFLRIRPLPDRDRSRPPVPAAKDLRRKPKQAAGPGPGPGHRPPVGELCLAPTGPNSVALTVPRSKLVDPKRGRTEVFDGFSAVFPSESTQNDIFTQVMDPLVDDFLGGKSGLLVAMGPTGSGKTHTIFGSPRNPGILPLTLRKILNAQGGNKVSTKPARSFSLSMFEILSEGKGEHILDLLSDAVECVLQQSVIKGLQEVRLSNHADAESLVSRGMLKRSTAATNANSNSSRSQCLITIRADSEHPRSSAVLTIADLAGAERERRTGNQGSRLLESNFINNTSMVFSLCLRSLLEYQKNQKKPLEKHFKNSMLTRYLRDYLEGRKKMTLILNVKPGDDDYTDTSFLLRQASPYMKIKYTSLEDSSDLASQKRNNVSLICQENKKKMKVQKPEVLVVEGNENIDTISEKDGAQHVFLNSENAARDKDIQIIELKNAGRDKDTKIMELKNAARDKDIQIMELKNAAKHKDIQIMELKNAARDKDIQIMELKKELKTVKYCLCKSSPITEDDPVDHDDSASSVFHLEAQELACCGPENSSSPCILKGKSDSCDDSSVSLIDEQVCSRDFKAELQVELDRPESFTVLPPAHTGGGATPASSYSDRSLTEADALLCLNTEGTRLSPQCTTSSKSATIGQIEERMEELSKIAVGNKDIQHDTNIIEEKKRCEPTVEKVTIGQSEERMEELSKIRVENKDIQHDTNIIEEKKRCEPALEKVTVELEHGIDCGQAPDQKCDHAPAKAAKAELQVLHKDRSESFIVLPPAHTDGGATPGSSYSDRSLTEADALLCLNTEGTRLSPQCTTSSKSATIGQIEERMEELSKIAVGNKDIQHDTNIIEEKKRCEPTVEKVTVELEHSIYCGQAPDQKCDHDPAKAAKAPSKDREADETADTNKEAPGSRPSNTKKTKRRLQPAAAMTLMLREFTGADIDADNEREERGRSSTSVTTGRSDALLQLLMKGRPGGPVRRTRMA